MTPLEIAARASWNLHHPMSDPWEKVPEFIRKGKIQQMKAALLALAECDLHDDLAGLGEDARWRADDDDTDSAKAMKAGFRAILRAIAEDPK